MNTALNIRDVGPEIKDALARRAKAEGTTMGDVAKAILAEGLEVGKRKRTGGTGAHLLTGTVATGAWDHLSRPDRDALYHACRPRPEEGFAGDMDYFYEVFPQERPDDEDAA